MSPRLPRVTAAEVISVQVKKGFALSRQSGSHKIYVDPAGNRVTVPFHAAKILHPKVMNVRSNYRARGKRVPGR